MSQEKTHDLQDFIQQLQDRMAAHYKQIQKRAPEDPGTTGDQGEENWRDLLSGWLPRTYEVVTKRRIIGQDGHISPQVDVLVLKSIYPKQLIDEGQKIFLAAGVAAAFECKTTLTAADIEKNVKNCVKIKNLYPVRRSRRNNHLSHRDPSRQKTNRLHTAIHRGKSRRVGRSPPCELGQEKYVTRIVERLMTAIQPGETKGEIPFLPMPNDGSLQLTTGAN